MPGVFSLRSRRFTAALSLAAAMFLPAIARAGDIVVKSGEKIAFLGDSITAAGAGSPTGYVHLVISGLAADGVKAIPVPAGISGHTSKDMLARLERDVISKKPDWMTLSCGVNDVWHGASGVALDKYKENITAIVDKAQAAGIKVVILTSTMIGEDQGNDNNKKLVAYNEFLHELAKEKKCPVAELNEAMQADVKVAEGAPPRKGNKLTNDGVHMNPLGDEMMATGILKAFGLDDSELKKAHAHEAWLTIPEPRDVNERVSLTLAQVEKLAAIAESRHQSVQEMLDTEMKKTVANLLESAAK